MKKIINIIIHIINCLLFLTMGIIFIVKRNNMVDFTISVIGILLILTVIFKIIYLFIKRKNMLAKIMDIVITLTISVLVLNSPYFFVSFLIMIFGIYALLQGLSGVINLYIYKQNNLRGKIIISFKNICSFVTAYLLLFSPIKNSKYLFIIIGIYLIIYAMGIVLSLFQKKKRLVIPLPIILTMFIPKLLIKKIEKNFKYNLKEDNIKPDLEILIHLAKGGSASMGHVEIAFEDKVYSYGCYNYMNRKLFGGMGDGILGVFDHDQYLKYCVNEKDRFIISFGVKLKESERQKIKNSIDLLINNNTIRWYPEQALYDMGLGEKKPFSEMANQIYKKANGIFYKFIKGKYKTFFVFRTNCVEIADLILASLGTKVINLEGVISPGTYYSYLEKEYNKKNSRIVTKTIYTKEKVQV